MFPFLVDVRRGWTNNYYIIHYAPNVMPIVSRYAHTLGYNRLEQPSPFPFPGQLASYPITLRHRPLRTLLTGQGAKVTQIHLRQLDLHLTGWYRVVMHF